MVRSGKERVKDAVPDADLLDAPDTVLSPDDARSLNGINRQLLPDAASQREAASRAAANKRSATAMSKEERAAKRLKDQQRRRREQKEAAERAAAAASATAGNSDESDSPNFNELNYMLEADGQEPIDVEEFDAFREWCDDQDLDMNEESYSDWCEDSNGREPFDAQREMDDWRPDDWSGSEEEDELAEYKLAASAPPPPPPPPPPPAGVAVEPEPEPDSLGSLSYLRPRVDDWQPSGGDWSPEGWGSPPSDDGFDNSGEAEPLPSDAALRERMKAVRDRRLPILIRPPQSPPQRMRLTARSAYYNGRLFTAKERLSAHVAHMSEGEAAHHCSLAPTRIGGYDGQVIMQAFDPEGEFPYYYANDAGRPDFGAVIVSHGDRNAFYRWLEGDPDHAPLPRLSARALSPVPYREQFGSAADFHDEQARWFRDHGDGSELKGTRSERNQLFDRLRDKLFDNRRERANPSGTRRSASSVQFKLQS